MNGWLPTRPRPNPITENEAGYLTSGLAAFLTIVGTDGLELAKDGELSPADAARLVRELGVPGSAEVDPSQLADFIGWLAEGSKLVRRERGRLRLTRTGRRLLPGMDLWDDPAPLLAQALTSIPASVHEMHRDVGVVWLIGLVLGIDRESLARLGCDLLSDAGWRPEDDDEELTVDDIERGFIEIDEDLAGLDVDRLIGRGSRVPLMRRVAARILLGDGSQTT